MGENRHKWVKFQVFLALEMIFKNILVVQDNHQLKKIMLSG